jgi:hypothetical protein
MLFYYYTFVEMHTFDLSIELPFNKYILLHVIWKFMETKFQDDL